ncbi:ATPase [Halosolutus gelatinilyticus]|uniref:ATPase n=1 Tax=Halosolutus gelatinilyticus TaxID=2931975 RepID=UPI001FF25F05|nr:ATPase [Halosolutus gelatinilyticus]
MNRDESKIKDEYHTLVRDVFEGVVREVNSHYPAERSVRLDWERIREFDKTIAKTFLRNPQRARGSTAEAIECWNEVDIPDSIVRVHNIPDEYQFRVGKQRTIHLGRLITITGEVVEMDGVKPFAKMAALECHQCGTLNYVPQSYGKMIDPHACEGCEKKSGPFLFRRQQSELLDYRKVILQRADTNLDDDPPQLAVYLTEDLVDRIGPGDHVSLVGYYDTGRIQKKSVLQTYLETWDIESHEEGVLADRLSPDELADAICEEVEAKQDEDPSSFGADREAIIETLVDEGVRRKEVESQLEDLIDQKEISEIGGGKLMVT